MTETESADILIPPMAPHQPGIWDHGDGIWTANPLTEKQGQRIIELLERILERLERDA